MQDDPQLDIDEIDPNIGQLFDFIPDGQDMDATLPYMLPDEPSHTGNFSNDMTPASSSSDSDTEIEPEPELPRQSRSGRHVKVPARYRD